MLKNYLKTALRNFSKNRVFSFVNIFGYRTTIGWSIFVLAAGIAMLIAILTISFQSIRAAMASPVYSLRNE